MNWKDLENESTQDLIEFIKSKDDPGYLELAEAAFVVITFRFRQKLIDQCVIMCSKWHLTEDDAIELANRIFKRFWLYSKFRQEKWVGRSVDSALIRYLNGIGNREIHALVNNLPPLYTGMETVVYSLIDSTIDHSPETLKKLQALEEWLDKMFLRLTPKHKTIYLTYKQHEISGRNLPGHLLKAMQGQLNLTQATIRVYKKQALELINSELNREKK
jgi:hypothetical protein